MNDQKEMKLPIGQDRMQSGSLVSLVEMVTLYLLHKAPDPNS